jgi:hypothetical protein
MGGQRQSTCVFLLVPRTDRASIGEKKKDPVETCTCDSGHLNEPLSYGATFRRRNVFNLKNQYCGFFRKIIKMTDHPIACKMMMYCCCLVI